MATTRTPKVGCNGKLHYSNAGKAHRAIKALEGRGQNNLHPYRCGECKGFHVGRRQRQGGTGSEIKREKLRHSKMIARHFSGVGLGESMNGL